MGFVVMLAACGGREEPHAPSCPAWFLDGDGDGFGDDAAESVTACDQPDGHVGNPYDCDDGNPDIHPLGQERCDPDDVDEDCDGIADNADPNALGRSEEGWRDADRDGHATLEYALLCDVSDGWQPEPGRDCDDADPGVYPHADDPIDGVDTNCDRLDGPAIYDDFESGGPDPIVWVSHKGLGTEGNRPAQGLHALTVAESAAAESVSIDTSACDALAWHYQVRSYSSSLYDEPLRLEYWDGAEWRPLDAWIPDGVGHWTHRWGTVTDPSALHGDLRVQLRADRAAGAQVSFQLDELMVGCAFASDDDGVPDGVDCSSADPLHWFDCATCVDGDGDAYGDGCDLGRDCDDGDASVHPLAADPPNDALDTDCTGLDGPDLFDDFDAGPDATTWSELVHSAIRVGDAASPPYALAVGPIGWAITPPLDLSSCDDGIWWEFQGLATDLAHYDVLTFSWEGPDGWVSADEWLSTDAKPPFSRRWGVVTDDAAARFAARFRLDAPATRWWFDDFSVACLVDADGDRVHDPSDCAPGDPRHWFDCGACTDSDGDGWGVGCDLGEDCDDALASVHPDAPDAPVDGVDQDCDGLDGPLLLFDDFEAAGPDPAVWTFVDDDVSVVPPTPPWEDLWSVRLHAETEVLEAAPVDTSSCPAVGWWVRGRGTSLGGDALRIEYWDGAAWALLEDWPAPLYGDGWARHGGTFGGAGALRQDLRIRVRAAPGSHYVQVDEFAFGCAPD